MNNPTIIETIARKMCAETGYDFDFENDFTRSSSGDDDGQSYWLGLAQAVLTAIEQSGHAIVPIEPTEAMIDAGYNSEDCDGWSGPTSCWQRMIQAGKVKP